MVHNRSEGHAKFSLKFTTLVPVIRSVGTLRVRPSCICRRPSESSGVIVCPARSPEVIRRRGEMTIYANYVTLHIFNNVLCSQIQNMSSSSFLRMFLCGANLRRLFTPVLPAKPYHLRSSILTF